MLLRIFILAVGMLGFSGGLIAYLHGGTDHTIAINLQDTLRQDFHSTQTAEGNIITNHKQNPPQREPVFLGGKPSKGWPTK